MATSVSTVNNGCMHRRSGHGHPLIHLPAFNTRAQVLGVQTLPAGAKSFHRDNMFPRKKIFVMKSGRWPLKEHLYLSGKHGFFLCAC